MKKRFSEQQIIGLLKGAGRSVPVKELCRKRNFPEAIYYLWRSKSGGMDGSEAKRLRVFETENAKLKKLLSELILEKEVVKESLRK